MKKITLAALFLLILACQPNEMTFDQYPTYDGNDLGITYSPQKTTLKVWSPPAEAMLLQLYEKGDGGEPLEELPLKKDDQTGVWSIILNGDYHGKYYTVQAQIEGNLLNPVPDPYAISTGVNGQRAMILDLKTTNPDGWENDTRPPLANYNDIVIYELHVRDLSSHQSAGIQHKGKFLGITELGTKSPDGLATGLDHLKEMGITHLHLLPSFDYLPRSVDETNTEARFNWGYDPQNYNVPEGGYATDPYDGSVRVKEFKQLVKTLHENGIRVVMDVVYNHTGDTELSNFNQIVPGYYYRQRQDGTFSDASACGNETASERTMMRKFMIESMKYWATEYHIDGFRVDLMGIHDIETMNLLSEELKQIDPSIFVYGEGWTAGDSPLPLEKRTLKAHTSQLDRIAAFSDDIRDGLKGSVFDHHDTGFVSGKDSMETTVKFGVIASTNHPQIDYGQVNYSDVPWAREPWQTITYVSCHDNHTLYDKLKISREDASEEDILKMHQLATGIVLTSQGIPFLHAGVEMLRTKNGVENSYQSPDSINQIVWTRKKEYLDNVQYIQNLILLRKNHPAFCMPTTEMISQHLDFLDTPHPNTVAYHIKGNANGDSWADIVVVLNGNAESKTITLPEGEWSLVVEGSKIDENGWKNISTEVTVPSISMVILKR